MFILSEGPWKQPLQVHVFREGWWLRAAGGSPAALEVPEVPLSPSMSPQSTASSATLKSWCSTTHCQTTARGSPSSLFLECFSQLPQVRLIFPSTGRSRRWAEARGASLGWEAKQAGLHLSIADPSGQLKCSGFPPTSQIFYTPVLFSWTRSSISVVRNCWWTLWVDVVL